MKKFFSPFLVVLSLVASSAVFADAVTGTGFGNNQSKCLADAQTDLGNKLSTAMSDCTRQGRDYNPVVTGDGNPTSTGPDFFQNYSCSATVYVTCVIK